MAVTAECPGNYSAARSNYRDINGRLKLPVMKTRAKGLLMVAFLGGILITSTVVIAIPGLAPTETDSPMVPSVTDLDYDYSANYPDTERAMFCGTGQPPGSTDYVREFEIPTACTNPLAISVDYDGNPWFVESNTGRMATFDLENEMFTEYPNPHWPAGATSMMWGMDYAPDGLVWFTDDASDSIWVFNTANGQYGTVPYPKVVNDPLPQRLLLDGSKIIVNDFYGNMLTFLDPVQPDSFLVAPSPIDGSVTAGFAPDEYGNIWYTTWQTSDGTGYLVKFHYSRYVETANALDQPYLPPIDFVDLYKLPPEVQTPNGIAISSAGNVWLADTTSSSVFEFNPSIRLFIQYVTADPMHSTYGNQTGVIKSPISRPYWMATDDAGRIVFNSHASNNISVLDPVSQKLVEYHVPSKNPYWSDCGASVNTTASGLGEERCGVAQIFDFDVYEDQIWFTEWAENKIGVVDTATPLPFDIDASAESVLLAPGTAESIRFSVVASNDTGAVDNVAAIDDDDDHNVQFTPFATLASEHVNAFLFSGFEDLGVITEQSSPDNGLGSFDVLISISENAPRGIYKVLLGAQAPDVAVGKFVTVTVP